MSNLQKFNNKLFQLEVKSENGEALFDVESVARSLGFTTTTTKNGKRYENVRWSRINSFLPQVAELKSGDFISEAMVYKLAFKANNPLAEKFQDWLAVEVLPSIRKYGAYASEPQVDPDKRSIELQMFDLLGKALARQERTTKELQLSTKRLEEKVESMEVQKVVEVQSVPVQEELVLKQKLYTTGEIAEPYGFVGATGVYRLHQLLHDKRIIHPTRKKSGSPGFVWNLYKKYQGKGYKDLSSVASSQKWTEEGKLFLESVLKNELS